MSRCQTCNVEMYYSSTGFYECRNFDCPPGTAAKYHKSWDLAKEFAPKLRKMQASLFTVEEICFINQRDHSGKEDGLILKEIYERVSR